MKKISFFLLALSVVVFFFSCSPRNVQNEITDKETLLLRLEANPVTLNPLTSKDVYGSAVLGLVFDGLITVDSQMNVIGSVARSWEISPDNKTFTFHLRRDVYFHDGVRLTSRDVKFTYETVINPMVNAQNKRADFLDVESLEIPDDTTVIVTYKRPFAPALLAWSIPIIPKHIYSDADDFNNHPRNSSPIGSGPYKFVSWETGQRIRLVKNENYWGDIKPNIKNIVYKIITEDNSALNAFLTNDIYIYGFVDPYRWTSFIGERANKQRFDFYEYYTMGYSYIGWNNRHPIFSDVNVRRAMSFALNRKEIVEQVYLGKAGLASGPFHPFSWASNPAVVPIDKNLDSARYYLAKAGWTQKGSDGILVKDGQKFEFVMYNTSASVIGQRIITILQKNLEELGIKMDIQLYEWATFVDKVHRRDFVAYTMGWSLAIDPDPFMLFHSSQKGHGLNYVGYSNPVADSLMELGQKIFDVEKRREIYHKLHKIIAHDQPYTFLFYRSSLVAVNNAIQNIHVSPLLGIRGFYPGILLWEIK